jgi:LPS-assembly protein
MALTPRFPLKQMIVGMRAAGFAATLPVLGLLCVTPVFADEPVNDVKLSDIKSSHVKSSESKSDDTKASDLKVNNAKKMDKEFEDSRYLDWVPVEQLTEEQKKTIPNICCKGAYTPPLRTDSDVELTPESAPIRAHADEQISEGQTRVQFKGNVSITQGNRSITTESATFDKTTNQAELSGGIQLRDPKVMVHADSGTTNVETGEAQFENARFVLYESRIHGVSSKLQKFGDNVINLEQSVISSCEPGDKAWSIRGSEISLHPDESYGTARNMRVSIQDVPVLYMPYIRFPVGNERLTGFLTPTPGYSKRNGTELAVPFYWNIAPDTDATITPHYLSTRGFMLDTELRHLSPYFRTTLDSSAINSDRGGYSSYLESQIDAGKISEEEAYPYRGRNRWYAKLDQIGGVGQDWSTNISYADLSDKDYLRDLYNGSTDSNRQAFIRQTASADYRTEHWFSGIKVDEVRLLTTSQLPNRELPRIHADGNYQFDDWVLKLNNEYVNFVQNRYYRDSFANTTDYDSAYLNTIYGERFNTNYSLTWDKSYTWGFIKPSIGARGLAYELDSKNLKPEADSRPSFVTPQASIDAGLFFERDTTLFGGSYLQTLEPRAFYFYSAYRDHSSLYNLTEKNSLVNFDTGDLTFNYNQLFRTTRFAGGDRLDDANQVALAVSTAFASKETGVERLRVSVGQIIYLRDREVTFYDNSLVDSNSSIAGENTRPTSDWAAQLSGQLNKRVQLSADAAYDQRNQRLDSANAAFHYMDDSYRIFNLSYRYTLKPVVASPNDPLPTQIDSMNQLDTSLILPISSRWSIIARNNHDFTYGVELDTYAGLEYNDCCYRVRIMGRRWLRVDYSTPNFLAHLTNDDFEPGIMFELELKGLGSMDKKISTLLDKTVTGFKDREKNLR